MQYACRQGNKEPETKISASASDDRVSKLLYKTGRKSDVWRTRSKENPQLLTYLRQTMGKMSIKDIKTSDYSVILRADDARSRLQNLHVPALALQGIEDYVAQPVYLALSKVKGGHASPLEAPKDVLDFIGQVIALKQ